MKIVSGKDRLREPRRGNKAPRYHPRTVGGLKKWLQKFKEDTLLWTYESVLVVQEDIPDNVFMTSEPD